MTDPVPLPRQAVPARVGQATAIEQSRAIAEVQAAIVVAQQCPRDIQAAITAMRQSCRMPQLANRAFFSFPRAGSTVAGPSVYLARELARCWGNIQYGVSELSRDDEHGQSEMQAFAWDLETNARAATIFIVPHMRDKRGGPERLTDMRDIYESNANAGARRVRECIFGILPPWYTEEAKELCNKTIKDGGGVPLPKRIANALGHFAALSVTEDDIARRLGRPTARWNEHDMAQLSILLQSIQRNEITRDEAFPATDVVTAEEIRSNGRTRKTPPPSTADGDDDGPTAEDLAAIRADAAAQAAEADAAR
jgi:hypothetical protein